MSKKTQTLLEKVYRKTFCIFIYYILLSINSNLPIPHSEDIQVPTLPSVAWLWHLCCSLLCSQLSQASWASSTTIQAPKVTTTTTRLTPRTYSPTVQPLYPYFIPQSHLTHCLPILFLPLHLIFSVTSGTAKIFHKRPKSKYIRICSPWFLLTTTEFCASKSKISHKQHVKEVRLCSKCFIYSWTLKLPFNFHTLLF